MNCCRVCRRNELKDCFSLNYRSDFYSQTGETLLEMLNFITGLNASFEDKLPQQLCRLCTGTLVAGYEFRNLCFESDTIFRQSLPTDDQNGKQSGQNDFESYLIKLEVEVEDTENDIVEKDTEGSEDRVYCCFPNCNVNYQFEELLTEHAELDHKLEKEENVGNCNDSEIRCIVCARAFDNEVDLLQHRNHGNVSLPSDSKLSLEDGPNGANNICGCGFRTNRTFSFKRHQAKCVKKNPKPIRARPSASTLDNISVPDKTNAEIIAMGFSIIRNITMFYCCIRQCATVCETHQQLCEHFQQLHPEARAKNMQGNANLTNIFRCQICAIGFPTKKKLLIHLEEAYDPKFRCNSCRYNCLSRKNAILHASVPCGAQMHRCSCGYSTPYTFAIKRHMQSFGCPMEGSFIRNYKNRPSKTSEQKTGSELLYKCQNCEKSFFNMASLRRHIESELSRALAKQEAKSPGEVVQGLEHKRYTCCWCQEITDDSNHLVQCMIQAENETGEDTVHKCSNCDKKFKNYNQYLEHRKSKACIKNSRLTCKLCSVKFPTRNILVKHMIHMHHKCLSKMKSHECKDCKRQFVTAYTLNRHRKTIHNVD